MLPVQIAEEVKRQVLHYIGATFEFRDSEAERALENFVTDPEKGLFKGPWIQLQRPFTQAEQNIDVPFDIEISFRPFRHQWRAWKRLSSKGRHKPEHTIVTTGTGSGKTECFLFPILDHCLRQKKKSKGGIKAVVLYPMNALANDQEKRFAKTIWKNEALKKAGVTVGLYTGWGSGEDEGQAGTKIMGLDHGITCHETLKENPPDILLTNYKMLDFLLMRPKDQKLWSMNEHGTLQYLVLDELHTYDGAQGADVACLIRRLKEHLGIKRGELCVVGTSATIDEGPISDRSRPLGGADQVETASEILCRFAGTLFEEDITGQAIIDEDRIPVDKLISFEGLSDGEINFPSPEKCKHEQDEDVLNYAKRQAALWGAPIWDSEHLAWKEKLDGDVIEKCEKQDDLVTICWELSLAEWLKKHPLFRCMLLASEKADKENYPLSWSELVRRAIKENVDISADLREFSTLEREQLLGSFLALIAHAKELRSRRPFPLIAMRAQLWMRELRRLGRVVDKPYRFRWIEEPLPGFHTLPAFHCTLCGESGWVGLKNTETETQIQARGVNGYQLISDPGRIYRASINTHGRRDPRVVYFSRFESGDPHPEFDGAQEDFKETEAWHIHPASLVVRRGQGDCPLSGDRKLIRIKINNRTTKNGVRVFGDQRCPHCGEGEGLFFIGARGATLSSVAIDEMFGSPLNSDAKLLAFTDSVQDASHRAGFFSARTYNFTFRTAVQHVLDEAGHAGVALPEIGKRVLEYWAGKDKLGGGSLRAAIESLLPPDLSEYQDYREFRESNATEPGPNFLGDLETRLFWEAVSEFGVMQTHGRRMERMGSAAVEWKAELIEKTIEIIQARLPGITPRMEGFSKEDLRIWILGLLYRYREKGALYHPYLDDYARFNRWGKIPDGISFPGREIYPARGRYKPALIVTRWKREHNDILATTTGNLSPWHVVWSRRVFEYSGDELEIIDLLRAFLKAGKESGLLLLLHSETDRDFYAISSDAVTLKTEPEKLVCSQTGKYIVRPPAEALYWDGAACLEYRASLGRYARDDFNARQEYYRARYRKGALRRVVAHEHTGLLGRSTREKLESEFTSNSHRDNTNVLTCTSTLEMGIDIGELSSTMLCSIPPSTANYLQRIGRAGRETGVSFILSVVNQRPHDLFFFARPQELLKGKVDTPGCWLDAAAVLLRQYLAFCLDCASKQGVLVDFPASAKALIEDEQNPAGLLRTLLGWIEKHEERIRSDFLRRFAREVKDNTRERFIAESATHELSNRIALALKEFGEEFSAIERAVKALNDRLKENGISQDERVETERELKIMRGRQRALQRVTSYELLCEHGLLPNYAFPDRGVRFFGTVYNKHRAGQEIEPVDLMRGASAAIRELAPLNHFYTHSRQYEIQKIAVGNPQESLIERFGVCGHCGFMLQRSGAIELGACPQCHRSGPRGPLDRGNLKNFIELPRSQAVSFMEFYDSLSSDRAEEREKRYYRIVKSFDATLPAETGVVGEDTSPFGIEYRSQLLMREVNTGFYESQQSDLFGPGQVATDEGFQVCRDCGAVRDLGVGPDEVRHTRNCSGRRNAEKAEKEGRDPRAAYRFEAAFLYRELKSEALRLLVPYALPADLSTLSACLALGLKRKFKGSPHHINIEYQVLPDADTNLEKHYIVLLDGVPGGTGYLKALFEAKDEHGRMGEGLMDVLRLARQTLETCSCRRYPGNDEEEDTDGCYRCIRTYYTQYRADEISRNRGVQILTQLIEAGERREEREELASISSNALFGSDLERRFIQELENFGQKQGGAFKTVIVKGRKGYRLELPQTGRIWDIELQRALNQKDGVMEPSRPDFIFWPEESGERPIAVFTDGREYHCSESHNRLADDFKKRRAILESQNFHVWSITWEDLSNDDPNEALAFLSKFDGRLDFLAESAGKGARDAVRAANKNSYLQFCGFLICSEPALWRRIGESIIHTHLKAAMSENTAYSNEFQAALWDWRKGTALKVELRKEDADFVFSERIGLDRDVIAFSEIQGVTYDRTMSFRIAARLEDNPAAIRSPQMALRWRRFLSCMNLYQFNPEFRFWTTSEVDIGTAPDIDVFFVADKSLDKVWRALREQVISSVRPIIDELATKTDRYPKVAYQVEELPSLAEAELAWPSDSGGGIVLLCGGQLEFRAAWEKSGWKVFTRDEVMGDDIEELVTALRRL